MKNLKNFAILCLSALAVLITSCSGSDSYRGSWKAMDADGHKFELVFDAKSFTLKDSTGSQRKFNYRQHSINIKNSDKTYGIRLSDGREYLINFPNKNDESTGLIKNGNGNPLYTIGRKDYVSYNDIYRLR